MSKDKKGKTRFFLVTRSAALIFLLSGLLVSSLLLNLGSIEPESVFQRLFLLQTIFSFLLALCLLSVVFYLKRWSQYFDNKALLLAVLGGGFLFIYSSFHLVEFFLSTPRIMPGPMGDIILLGGGLFSIAAFFLWQRERLELERTLQESEALYRGVVESQTDLIVKMDTENRFTFVNDAYCELFGKNRSELIGREFIPLVHEEDQDHTLEAMKRLKAPPYRVRLQQRAKTVHGYRWISWENSAMFNEEGEIAEILGVGRDITELTQTRQDLKEKEQKVRHMSFHDLLTGLCNRNFAGEELERLDTESQLPFSIIMGDVNGLKLLNDAYGHAKGDELLCKSADILRESCCNEHIISRWGGDEFVILLPQTENREAEKICERIKQECQNTFINRLQVSVALGAATKQEENEDIRRVMAKAEERMYQNKMTQTRGVHTRLLQTLMKLAGSNSYETEEHCRRLQQMGLDLGKEIGLSPEELDRLCLALSLHDIGKSALPHEILTKEEELTADERLQIKKHPERGFHIVEATKEFSHIAYPILYHHERWDGTGYPEGLAGEDIPLISRIISVVDAYDAMVSVRPYSESRSKEEALAELKRNSGSQFDPGLVEIFVKLV